MSTKNLFLFVTLLIQVRPTFCFGCQELSKWKKRREDSEETSQELRLAREQLQNTVIAS